MPRILGHRGASAYAPENTLAAFREAITLGADGFELDVTLSADGEVVVIHDDTLNRTTTGSGRVDALPLAQLKRLDAGQWFSPVWAGERIPTLGEVFASFATVTPRPFINVELKRDQTPARGLAAAVVALVHAHQWQSHVLLSSFDLSNLQRLQALDAMLPLGALYTWPWQGRRLHRALPTLKVQAHHPQYRLLSAQEMQWFHAHGYQVNTWTVNEETALRRLITAGVDGLITDMPDVARRVLNESAPC